MRYQSFPPTVFILPPAIIFLCFGSPNDGCKHVPKNKKISLEINKLRNEPIQILPLVLKNRSVVSSLLDGKEG